jgi:hypothetical protein
MEAYSAAQHASDLAAHLPELQGIWAFVPLGLIGVATIILLARVWSPSKPAFVDTAKLHLRYYGDGRPPTMVSHLNVWRWYSLRNYFTVHHPQIGYIKTSGINIFISFEPHVMIGSVILVSHDFVVPKHEVKEFNSRFAIIAIDEVPAGVLDISFT